MAMKLTMSRLVSCTHFTSRFIHRNTTNPIQPMMRKNVDAVTGGSGDGPSGAVMVSYSCVPNASATDRMPRPERLRRTKTRGTYEARRKVQKEERRW